MTMRAEDAELIAESAKRRQDGLRLFRPFPLEFGPSQEFIKCTAREQIFRGGNQSSKTTSSAAKVAAIARDVPITFHDGTQVDCRLPHQKGRPLLIWVIGYDWAHIGDTLYRLLFTRQAFKVIRDKKTRVWRAWKPWDPEDKAREAETEYAPPLIPPSEVKKISWEVQSADQVKRVELTNGTVIRFYPSTAEAKAGDTVDVIWIDEKIHNEKHVAEWQPRLSARRGVLIWSTWPATDNDALRRMSDRAREQAEEVKEGKRAVADIVEFRSRYSQNPFIDEEEKRKTLAAWSDTDRKARDEGEYVTDGVRIYPTFSRLVHGAVCDTPALDDALSQFLRGNGYQPGPDWCLDFILDPGSEKPGGLIAGLPPPRLWAGPEDPYYVVLAEIYGRRMDADTLAAEAKVHMEGRSFRRFIIDGQAARQTPMGFASTIGANYTRAFADKGLRCEETESVFIPGDPDFRARSMIVESWLSIRGNGRPRLRIVTQRCPHLCWQMENNEKAMTKDVAEERPAKGQKDDLRNCIEYWASRRPTYVPPQAVTRQLSEAELFMQYVKRTFGKTTPETNTVHFGPGPLRSSA